MVKRSCLSLSLANQVALGHLPELQCPHRSVLGMS